MFASIRINNPSKTEIESELRNCNLASQIQNFHEMNRQFNQNFEKVDQQFVKVEEKFSNLDDKFDVMKELVGMIGDRSKDNAKQIEDIKGMVDKIYEMLSRK